MIIKVTHEITVGLSIYSIKNFTYLNIVLNKRLRAEKENFLKICVNLNDANDILINEQLERKRESEGGRR